MKEEHSTRQLLKCVPAEIKDCLKGLNPFYATRALAYTENCKRCVMAYEVRRRGYFAIAKPHLMDKADPLLYMDAQHGWPAVFQEQNLVDCSALTQKQAQENVECQMHRFGNRSRAIVKVNWLHRAKGHLFVAENIDDVIYFVDPQTGENDVSRYFQYVDPNRVAMMRIDCVKFTGLVWQCCS